MVIVIKEGGRCYIAWLEVLTTQENLVGCNGTIKTIYYQ